MGLGADALKGRVVDLDCITFCGTRITLDSVDSRFEVWFASGTRCIISVDRHKASLVPGRVAALAQRLIGAPAAELAFVIRVEWLRLSVPLVGRLLQVLLLDTIIRRT